MAPDDLSPFDLRDDRFAEALPVCESFPYVAQPTGLQRRVLYSVPCPRSLFEAATKLARVRGVELADLVETALTLVAPELRASIADPGSGLCIASVPAAVLKLVLAPGLDHSAIRQALAVMLALNSGEYRLTEAREQTRFVASVDRLRERNRRLHAALETLAFDPLPDGPKTAEDAVAILGLAGRRDPQRIAVRFRALARIYHPDSGSLPCKVRMAQVIEARNLLVHEARRR